MRDGEVEVLEVGEDGGGFLEDEGGVGGAEGGVGEPVFGVLEEGVDVLFRLGGVSVIGCVLSGGKWGVVEGIPLLRRRGTSCLNRGPCCRYWRTCSICGRRRTSRRERYRRPSRLLAVDGVGLAADAPGALAGQRWLIARYPCCLVLHWILRWPTRICALRLTLVIGTSKTARGATTPP